MTCEWQIHCSVRGEASPEHGYCSSASSGACRKQSFPWLCDRSVLAVTILGEQPYPPRLSSLLEVLSGGCLGWPCHAALTCERRAPGVGMFTGGCSVLCSCRWVCCYFLLLCAKMGGASARENPLLRCG